MKRACACVKKDSDAEVLWEQQSYSEKKKLCVGDLSAEIVPLLVLNVTPGWH